MTGHKHFLRERRFSLNVCDSFRPFFNAVGLYGAIGMNGCWCVSECLGSIRRLHYLKDLSARDLHAKESDGWDGWLLGNSCMLYFCM